MYRVFPDVNTEILALQSGEVDVIANALPPAQVEQLKATEGIEVAEATGLGYAHMVYNMQKPNLDKLEVRQALAHAVDYEAIRNVVLQGQAVSTGSSPLMPVLAEYYDDSITEYEFDVDTSRALMEEAGFTADSSGMFPVSFRLIYSLQDSVTSQWAQMVKDVGGRGRHRDRAPGHGAQHLPRDDRRGRLRHLRRQLRDHGRPGDELQPVVPARRCDQLHLRRRPGARTSSSHEATVTQDKDEKIGIMQEAAKIVHEQVYDNIMYTQNLFFAHSADWTGFISKPSELLSIVNPLSLASAQPVG